MQFFRKCPQIFPKIFTKFSENVHKMFSKTSTNFEIFPKTPTVKIFQKMFTLQIFRKMSTDFSKISINFFDKSVNFSKNFRKFS